MPDDKNEPQENPPRPVAPLKPEHLYQPCDPNQLAFTSTAELEDLTAMVGQERAVDAIVFAVKMNLQGFNAFVLGPPGTGRHSFVRRFLSHKAGEGTPGSDWCYVNHFADPRKPIALELPAGRGRKLCLDMEQLVEEAHTAIPKAFEGEAYQARRQAIEEEFGREQAQRFQEIRKKAQERGIALIQTPAGFTFVPIRNGKAMSSREYQNLSEEEQKHLQEETRDLTEELQQAMQDMPKLVRSVHEKIRHLDREFAMLAAGSLIDDLLEEYAEFPKVLEYLKSVQKDIIENFSMFLDTSEHPQAGKLPKHPQTKNSAKQHYSVNLLVDQTDIKGAPLVIEDNPTFQNLVGAIEHHVQMGALVTDFTLIKSGALHRANGGYLVLDAFKLLTTPFAWEGLKLALRTKQIRMESLSQAYSLTSTATLEPEPVPLNVKVFLIGDRWLYYRLQALDPEFLELFKVAADFNDQMERSEENNQLFARLLGTLAKQEDLKPLDREAVARLIEESARHAEHSKKLSGQVGRVADIMREANYWASQNGKEIVSGEDIQCAVEHRIYRSSRLRERLRNEILEETLLIDTDNEKIGQVNGLAVVEVGDFSFARPNRITARVSLGSGKVMDIEREAKLGGPIHSKGVLILSGFLASHFVTDRPLSLAASLVFEQSYSGVEGDSASSAELYALLSALAETPILQSYAVTGSVNQYGEVQAIGGVNQKIEGFFDICNARGLTGKQGVLIPASNVKHLMLRRPVIEAVEAGKFSIYPIQSINQGIELLTGMPAGELDASGNYPEGTLFHRVKARLIGFADKRRRFIAEPKPES